MSTLSRADNSLTGADIPHTSSGARVDLVLVAQMVEQGAKVLDVGCGDGELLRLLSETRGVDGRGEGPGCYSGRRRHRSWRLSGRCV